MHMRLVTAYLVFAAMVYATIGTAGLVAPAWLMGLVAIELPEASALSEIRAAYGGQLLGLALIVGLGALRSAWRRWTLTLFVAAAGGMLLARLLSVAIDGAPNTAVWVLGAMELSGALAGAALMATWPRAG
jgi:hypothetical protein